MSNKGLHKVRERIDALDQEIQRLLNERAQCALEVARVKLEQDPQAQFYRPEREAQILRTVKERNRGPLGDETMARLFREIMSACLALEHPLQVAYLGPEGTFTQAAAIKHFGHAVVTHPAGSIAEIFREVEAGDCQYGVVPVENSTEGVITHTLDLFIHSPLKICGEVMLRIHHNLLTHAPDLEAITEVYSHQQSLGQCRAWLDRHLPRAERIAVGSNAEAARIAASEGNDIAAIAGETAAEIYGVPCLHSNIEDEPDNTTRFLVIGRESVTPSGDDKTSLLLSTRNVAGALHKLLSPLAEKGISMTRIESRPSRRDAWDYVFFVDILGHADDSRVAEALEELRSQAGMYKELGSFPRAVL
ncbi:MAG: chorismate mutase [Gammaproteobacteria bacterium RIFOXYA12_FULL_61_12]|nr:MAG: chorismate mutase [Gammaproteobacteria bacterium RIFOXYD12_FULL_61_37]OGT93337.1 MAG: chorismate mutase [Gammaproteobacteria bacterium RIFOXYA12_FULL_61_12]